MIDCALKSIGRRLCMLTQSTPTPKPVDDRCILIEAAVTQCVVKLKESGKLVALAEHGKSALSDQSGSKL